VENSSILFMKAVTHIDCPKEWESGNDWDSHRPALYLAAINTRPKDIVELGCGYGSTTLLNELCKSSGRPFFSFETNRDWAKKFDSVQVVSSYEEAPMLKYKGGLLFVDCAPGDLRKKLIEKHADDFGVLIIHDTETGADYVYGMAEILSTFKYRLDYRPEGKPHTTAVSNFINVEEWL
jgi:hypothetical protein